MTLRRQSAYTLTKRKGTRYATWQRASPLPDIATEAETTAPEDEYFVSCKRYPNVDVYSRLIYAALGMLVEMFPVLFRDRPLQRLDPAAGLELIDDQEPKIARPRQIHPDRHQLHYLRVAPRS